MIKKIVLSSKRTIEMSTGLEDESRDQLMLEEVIGKCQQLHINNIETRNRNQILRHTLNNRII